MKNKAPPSAPTSDGTTPTHNPNAASPSTPRSDHPITRPTFPAEPLGARRTSVSSRTCAMLTHVPQSTQDPDLQEFVGRTLTAFNVLGVNALKTVEPSPRHLVGETVVAVSAG